MMEFKKECIEVDAVELLSQNPVVFCLSNN